MSNSGITTLLLVGGALGSYALYRHLKGSSHAVHGEFLGLGPGGSVDYLNPADAMRDKRPNGMYFMKPYSIFNMGGGMRPVEIDAQGQETGRHLVLPGEQSTGLAPMSYILVGVEASDFAGCDPYQVSGDDAGWIAVGRGGGGGGGRRPPPQQQQDQGPPEEGPPGDPYAEPQPPPPPPPHYPHHHGRRR
jgi:hypothetical protein